MPSLSRWNQSSTSTPTNAHVEASGPAAASKFTIARTPRMPAGTAKKYQLARAARKMRFHGLGGARLIRNLLTSAYLTWRPLRSPSRATGLSIQHAGVSYGDGPPAFAQTSNKLNGHERTANKAIPGCELMNSSPQRARAQIPARIAEQRCETATRNGHFICVPYHDKPSKVRKCVVFVCCEV